LPSEAPTRAIDADTTARSQSRFASERPAAASWWQNKPFLIFIGLAVAVILTSVFGYRYFTAAKFRSIDSIAVMPFANESGNPDVDYLSDGMTETLINTLTQVPNLNVKPRSSTFRYKGRESEVKTIGNELNVRAVLNGRLVQRGDDITLFLSLVDTGTENQIWGKQYNRKLANLITLQSEIVRDISGNLRSKLTGAEEQKLAKNYTANAEAYQLYLQGRYFWNKQDNKDVDRSIEYFRKAIEIDPNYALAYAGLADAYSLNVVGSNRERMAKAREAATKAISLDENLAEAHASLCRIIAVDDYDFAGAEREIRRAIELEPNYGTAHHFYADILSVMGRHEESEVEYRRALELEPFSLVFNATYGGSLVNARKFDEGIAQLKKTLEMDPNFRTARLRLSLAYEVTGRYAESIEERAKALEISGDKETADRIREVFAKEGWNGYLRYLTGENRPPTTTSYARAAAYVGLGEKEKAFEALNASYENHEITLLQLVKNDPRLDPLRSDPRFADILRRVGLPQ
jgi:TolB-like protein/Tfp pilus assembly protein PilF